MGGEISGKGTDFRLVFPFSDESLGAASSEGGDALGGEGGSFFARAGAMGKELQMRGGDGCRGLVKATRGDGPGRGCRR